MAAVHCSRGREGFIILTSARNKKKDRVIESTPKKEKKNKKGKEQFKQKCKSKIRLQDQKDRNLEDCFV